MRKKDSGQHKKLQKAKLFVNDEYYTRYEDIEKELAHYKDYFNNKIVYCNCDDYRWSEFKNYFYNNFNNLKLKNLICTCYHNLNFNLFDEAEHKVSYKYEYDGINETITELQGDGDCRSLECKDILKECDIVVTNPPFSIFREYIKMLYDYDKKFIIIGSNLACAYKYVFPLYYQNKLFIGYHPLKKFIKMGKLTNVAGYWYTNFEINKEVPFIELTKKYNPIDYPKYDNFDAINVNSYKDIPCDYYEIMGVPINTGEKLNKKQFELIGLFTGVKKTEKELGLYSGAPVKSTEFDIWKYKERITYRHGVFLKGNHLFKRLLIKRVV